MEEKLKFIEWLIEEMKKNRITFLRIEHSFLGKIEISLSVQPLKTQKEEMVIPAAKKVKPETISIIKSPCVGRFYCLVKEGQEIKKGEELAKINVLRVENDICSETSGRIVSILVENGMAVEFGQPLIEIEIGE